MTRLFKWSLTVGGLALGAWTLWDLWATNQLEKVVTDLRSRGLATTLAELEAGLPPFDEEPTAAQNAAPILEAAFVLAKSIPPLPEWDPGEGFEVPEDVRSGLRGFDEVFDLLYEAAERPRCRFDINWADGCEALMPHISRLRGAAKLLRKRAFVRWADGDVEDAIEDVRIIFSLSRALREEPILLSQIVRIAVAEMGLDALHVILPRSESAMEALAKASPDVATGAMERALQGELATALSIATKRYSPEFWNAMDPWGEVRMLGLILSDVGTPYIKADVAFLASFLARSTEMARKPYPAVVGLIDGVLREVSDEGGAVTAMFLRRLVGSVILPEARYASRVALTRVGVRCIDYRREHGKYPSKIRDLKDIDPDPLTGRSFVLESRAAGILLRSEASEDIEWELGVEG